VILRLIRGRARPDQVEALRAGVTETLAPGSGAASVPARYHLGQRWSGDQVEVIFVVFWASPEALAVADDAGVSPLRIAERMDVRFLEAAHFEIDETILRHSDRQPVAIRVATGRFSKPGSDIEMQDLLRHRAPLLGDEMTEAYVGRRIMGRAVEVTFVSAWQQLPEDRKLEDTFWPDIALRYDHFSVEVYGAISDLAAATEM
jgi:hypothetical protein